jgi:hypothetical protein
MNQTLDEPQWIVHIVHVILEKAIINAIKEPIKLICAREDS